MTQKAFILGPRQGGAENGIFIAPPGYDAETASAEQLLLHISSGTLQIVQRGVAAGPFPQVVPHALGFAPVVFPNLISTGLVSGAGYIRPFDSFASPFTKSQIWSGATQITVTQSGDAIAVNYWLYNRAAP